MNGRRTCVFYSKGRNYIDVLRAVRRDEPDSHIVAMIPMGYPISEAERALVDEVIEVPQTAYSLRRPATLTRLINGLRTAHYDAFVITFDSPRLNLLAAVSGANEKIRYTFSARREAIHPTIPATLFGVVARHVWGNLVYLGILAAVYGLRIKK